MMLRIVRAGPRRRHSVTLAAVKGDANLQRFGLKRAVPQLIENAMCIERTIIIANPRMVAPNDQVRATEILANQGMQQRLARTCITHFDRIARLDDGSGTEIVIDHRLDRSDANVSRNVASLQLAEHLMYENCVRYLQSDFDQMLVTAVHGISRLEGGDTRPALFKEHGARLGRANIEVRILTRIFAFVQYHHPTGQIDVTLMHHLRHAWMLRIGGAIDVFGLNFLVDGIFLANLHDGEYVAAADIHERDLFFGRDAGGEVFVHGKRYRDRPKKAAGQFHVQAGTTPVIAT